MAHEWHMSRTERVDRIMPENSPHAEVNPLVGLHSRNVDMFDKSDHVLPPINLDPHEDNMRHEKKLLPGHNRSVRDEHARLPCEFAKSRSKGRTEQREATAEEWQAKTVRGT